MDAFSYLSVLLSIIIGLAMTQVLQGYRALLLNRGRVVLYFPPLAWSAYILVMATQSWWSSFGLADHREWAFATFAVILLQTVLLYMLAGVVLPDIAPDRPVDLRAHYFREATPLYAIMLAMLAASVAKAVLLDGHLPEREDGLFHAVFAALALTALLNRRPWVHQAIVALTGLLLISYIALLFARL